jgi:hypothetical protein
LYVVTNECRAVANRDSFDKSNNWKGLLGATKDENKNDVREGQKKKMLGEGQKKMSGTKKRC